MMKRFVILTLIPLLLGFFVTQRSRAELVQQKPEKRTSKFTLRSDADLIQENRKSIVHLVQGFAETIASFNDVGVKSSALARLADLLWKDEESYARQLFERALGFTSSNASLSPKEIKELSFVRREIISVIARRDPAWAKKLTEAGIENSDAERMETNFNVAYGLLDRDPGKVSDFAERSLGGGVHPGMFSLLNQLRLKDKPAANALFAAALNRLGEEPYIDGNTFLMLGTYLFTSRRAEYLGSTGIAQIGVGDLLVPDITADRPDVPQQLVRQYLMTALTLIGRRVTQPTQQQLYYVIGYLLLPKAEKFAPELVGPLVSAMSSLVSSVPQELTDERTYQNFAIQPAKSVEDLFKEIERMPNERHRNERYLSIVFDLWLKGDYEQAKTAVAKITDTNAASQLSTLIDFTQTTRLIETGKISLSSAEVVANRLPSGVERSVLWLNIARGHAQSGDAPQAKSAIYQALKSGQNITDVSRPYFMLSAVNQLLVVDPAAAQPIFSEAIKAFNGLEKENLAKKPWQRRIETGLGWRDFPLKTKAVVSSFDDVFPGLAKVNLEGSLAAINELADEKVRAEALTAMASALLKN
jgi:hypothetical protein